MGATYLSAADMDGMSKTLKARNGAPGKHGDLAVADYTWDIAADPWANTARMVRKNDLVVVGPP